MWIYEPSLIKLSIHDSILISLFKNVIVFFRVFLFLILSLYLGFFLCFVLFFVCFFFLLFCLFVVFCIIGTFNKTNGCVDGRICDKVLFGSSRQQNINSNLLVSLVGRNPLYSVLYPSIDNVPMLKPIKYKTINHSKKKEGIIINGQYRDTVNIGQKIPRPKASKDKTHITRQEAKKISNTNPTKRTELTHMFAKGK